MKYSLLLVASTQLRLSFFTDVFWRIFNWPQTLMSLNNTNRATMQVLNISITFIFFILAYISFSHTDELLKTQLGNSLLVLIACLWIFRAAQQVIFYKLQHKASVGLTLFFLTGAFLYGTSFHLAITPFVTAKNSTVVWCYTA